MSHFWTKIIHGSAPTGIYTHVYIYRYIYIAIYKGLVYVDLSYFWYKDIPVFCIIVQGHLNFVLKFKFS